MLLRNTFCNNKRGKEKISRYKMLNCCRMTRKRCITRRNSGVWALIQDQERRLITEWRDKRNNHPCREYKQFLAIPFGLETMRSFIADLNIMVFIHVGIVVVAVYLFQKYNLMFDISVALFVSPIVFPLAFSINSDFQRREKVLEDLAAFKSAGIAWYFSMRELKGPAGLGRQWVKEVRGKLISLLFLIGEYLLTTNPEKRRTILRAIYDDFAGAHELVEKLRASKLPANTAIVSRIIHFIHLMGLSVERLRVIRDYRSPRSIRSFNKVFIMVLLIVLAPYFVHLGKESNNFWLPYVLGVVIAFIFSTLLGVQDKLDDPFDGLGEDDINVETMDEWAPILESVHPNPTMKNHTDFSFFEENLQMPPLQEDSMGSREDIFDEEEEDGEENLDYNLPNIADDLSSNNDCNVCSDYSVYSSPEISESNEQLIAERQSSMLDETSFSMDDPNVTEACTVDNPLPQRCFLATAKPAPSVQRKLFAVCRPSTLKSAGDLEARSLEPSLDGMCCDIVMTSEDIKCSKKSPKLFSRNGDIGSHLFSPFPSTSCSSRRGQGIFDIQSCKEKEMLGNVLLQKI